MPTAPPLLRLEHVSVQRESKLALDDVSLSIDLDENVAIIGPNGSGKSTLIKTLTRELYPLARPETRVEVMGRARWHVWELRTLLGIVSNDLMATCTREITGLEAVLSGFFSSIGVTPEQHTVTPAMLEKAGEVLDRLEVSHLAGRFVSEMSSGEGRRILIGRALVHSPKALLFDEPSNSLDLHAFQSLRSVMRKLAEGGTSIILVTHHLPDIIPAIGRVVLFKDGRVFRDGPKREILTSATLSELFQTPLELLERDGYYNLW